MKDWLDVVREITSSDRQRDYGHPLLNFLRISLHWNIEDVGRMRRGIYDTPLQVAKKMYTLKISRDDNQFKEDNHIDVMGYGRAVGRMHALMIGLGYSDGIRALAVMNHSMMFLLLEDLVEMDAERMVELEQEGMK